MAVNPIPEGYNTLTPYMLVDDAAALLSFIQEAFGAEVLERMDAPDGSVAHAQARIGNSRVMLGQSTAQWPARPGGFYMYVDDCDAAYRRALEAGGRSLREPTNEFYGDRSAGVEGPGGVQWWLATHIEDVSPEEIQRRGEQVMAQRATEGQGA